MTNHETVLAFIRSINARDARGLGELMSDDHRFIDALGNEVVGKEKMVPGWRGYFEWFPDYWIEVNEVLAGEASAGEQTFAMFGFAGGSFKGNSDASWRIPAAWKAIVKDGRISLWQVFADTKAQLESMQGGTRQ
jgi:ketosteroid isomerase-like protein